MKTQKKDGDTALILKVPISSKSEDRVLKMVDGWIGDFDKKNEGKRLIFTPNPEMLVEASQNEDFLEVLNKSDLNIADGTGLVLASWYLRVMGKQRVDQTISSRLTGTDMMPKMVRLAALRGYRVFLLGGWARVAERAAGKMVKQLEDEGVKIHKDFAIDWYSGVRDVRKASGYKKGVMVRKINEFRPDILFVSFGPVRQETWLVENREKLDFGVAMGVGGAFDYVSGKVRRAPRWVRRAGFEWLFRLVNEPWRWRRQVRLFRFVGLVLEEGLE